MIIWLLICVWILILITILINPKLLLTSSNLMSMLTLRILYNQCLMTRCLLLMISLIILRFFFSFLWLLLFHGNIFFFLLALRRCKICRGCYGSSILFVESRIKLFLEYINSFTIDIDVSHYTEELTGLSFFTLCIFHDSVEHNPCATFNRTAKDFGGNCRNCNWMTLIILCCL